MATTANLSGTGTSAYVSIPDLPKMLCTLDIDIPAAISGVTGSILFKTPGDSLSRPKTALKPDFTAIAITDSMSVQVPGHMEYAINITARTGSGDIRVGIQQSISGVV